MGRQYAFLDDFWRLSPLFSSLPPLLDALPPLLGSGGTGFYGSYRIRSDTTEGLSGENDCSEANSPQPVIPRSLGFKPKNTEAT
jgi:hypothetical protein